MKRSLSKTLGSLFLAIALCFSTCSVAFAAESNSENALESRAFETTVSVEPRAYGEPDSGIIPARGSLTLYPKLNSYVGVSRTFFFFADNIYSDSVPAGDIKVWVYKPNSEILQFFTVKAKGEKYIKCTLPASGTYKVVVESTVREKIQVSAGWTK